MATFKFQLGQRVKDIVTGFTGIIIGRLEYLNGCIQYGIKPGLDKDGKILEASWIDQAQIEVIDNGIFIEQTMGGPNPDAPKC